MLSKKSFQLNVEAFVFHTWEGLCFVGAIMSYASYFSYLQLCSFKYILI